MIIQKIIPKMNSQVNLIKKSELRPKRVKRHKKRREVMGEQKDKTFIKIS
jgi:hypothetical protein